MIDDYAPVPFSLGDFQHSKCMWRQGNRDLGSEKNWVVVGNSVNLHNALDSTSVQGAWCCLCGKTVPPSWIWGRCPPYDQCSRGRWFSPCSRNHQENEDLIRWEFLKICPRTAHTQITLMPLQLPLRPFQIHCAICLRNTVWQPPYRQH